MQIAILAYEKMTLLDAIGPYDVLNRLPDADVRFVARETGVVRGEQPGVALYVEHRLDEVTEPDIVVIPGGYGNRVLLEDSELHDWLRAAHEHTQYTTSVCTGALLLAAAGILDGVEATTHWMARDFLASLGAVPVADRVVERGKIITAAGVSAGIDMALTLVQRLHGDDVAQMVQLGIEYDPQPPFDAGSPEKAPEHIVAGLRSLSIDQV